MTTLYLPKSNYSSYKEDTAKMRVQEVSLITSVCEWTHLAPGFPSGFPVCMQEYA